jgi:hypothetical protein
MISSHKPTNAAVQSVGVVCLCVASFCFALRANSLSRVRTAQAQEAFRGQTQEEADHKSSGCISCHGTADEPTMHATKTVLLGCTDCHGGNASISVSAGTATDSAEYNGAKEKAHVQPREARLRDRSALPERLYTNWLKESAEYVKFINPGDLRVAPETCGTVGCHASEVRAVSTSMMTHSGMLWGAALYNNGATPYKNTRFGESYSREGIPQSIKTSPAPSAEETRTKGVLAELKPLNRWEISPAGQCVACFWSAAAPREAEIGESDSRRRSGKPDDKLSERGFAHGVTHRSGVSRTTENTAARSGSLTARDERSFR